MYYFFKYFIYFYLNTSYVEVKQIQLGTDTTLYANLNTSYVEVKRFIFLKILVILSI